MKNIHDNYIIETRILKTQDEDVSLGGRFLQGFKNNSVTNDLVVEVLDNSMFDIDTIGDTTTMVICTLPNGYKIIETSTCLTKENYDEAIGVEECLAKIKSKVWELLGFLLATATNGFVAREKEQEDEEMIDKAISLALDEIIEEKLGIKIEHIVDTKFYKQTKEELLANVGKMLKRNLAYIALEEKLDLEDMVELVVGLYLASEHMQA